MPGTAAEVLDDSVRRVICPEKLNSATWLEIVGTAHRLGLPTTSTMLCGHIETATAGFAFRKSAIAPTNCDRPKLWGTHYRIYFTTICRTGSTGTFAESSRPRPTNFSRYFVTHRCIENLLGKFDFQSPAELGKIRFRWSYRSAEMGLQRHRRYIDGRAHYNDGRCGWRQLSICRRFAKCDSFFGAELSAKRYNLSTFRG
jgi:hypothetical protein